MAHSVIIRCYTIFRNAPKRSISNFTWNKNQNKTNAKNTFIAQWYFEIELWLLQLKQKQKKGFQWYYRILVKWLKIPIHIHRAQLGHSIYPSGLYVSVLPFKRYVSFWCDIMEFIYIFELDSVTLDWATKHCQPSDKTKTFWNWQANITNYRCQQSELAGDWWCSIRINRNVDNDSNKVFASTLHIETASSTNYRINKLQLNLFFIPTVCDSIFILVNLYKQDSW